ncbi:MAG: homoserine O-succinyltransferase [Chitinispirillaceae bacterium]|nr:homoserine O-succinyltransferase [Chitinispirillaceae bacterium]
MTIILPKNYHIQEALEKSRILCIDPEKAAKEDIRALRIGILNIMPEAETYEYSLLHPLGRSVLQIDPVWIRLNSHAYSSTDRSHLEHFYQPFEEAVDKKHLDGLLLTGAPVENIEFDKVNYWEELKRILRYARKNIASTLGICWGGLAIAKYLGIDKERYPKKIFGVYKTENLDRDHRITGDMDDTFWCAQSRHAGIADGVLETARDEGAVNLLAYAKGAGYTIFESADQRFLVHIGHPEYEPGRLIEEYERDRKKGRTDVDAPQNLDLAEPKNIWRTHRNEFFSQWVKYIHETTKY